MFADGDEDDDIRAEHVYYMDFFYYIEEYIYTLKGAIFSKNALQKMGNDDEFKHTQQAIKILEKKSAVLRKGVIRGGYFKSGLDSVLDEARNIYNSVRVIATKYHVHIPLI